MEIYNLESNNKINLNDSEEEEQLLNKGKETNKKIKNNEI